MQPDCSQERRLNILVLYDQNSIQISTVRDHLESFARFSRHHVFYAHATGPTPLHFSLDPFDVIIIHYSVRLAYASHISPAFALALHFFRGLKALFIQDEYDNTWQACRWINSLGVGVVFSCVPARHVAEIYSLVNHRKVRFVPTLTGYIPTGLEQAPPIPPLDQRRIVIGYRGRELPFRYGLLAREKLIIGQRMRAICEARRIPHDIEWAEKHRLYGPSWFRFLGSCRATLATESGSNVFDFDGSLAQRVNRYVRKKKSATFDEIQQRFLQDRERPGLMNQISPRVFEAIATKTGLVLFEGSYSGIIQPDEHYVALKKDFSNVDDVLARVQDDSYLGPMIDRAYQHVLGSGLYTYRRFVEGVDQVLLENLPRDVRAREVTMGIGLEGGVSRQLPPVQESSGPSGRRWPATLARTAFRAAKVISRHAGGAIVKRFYKRMITASRLLRKDETLRAAWNSIRSDPRSRAAFGTWFASIQEFLHLALLRCGIAQTATCLMPWYTEANYNTVAGRLQFTSYPLYDMPEVHTKFEAIREACFAVRRGTLKEIIWNNGREMMQFVLPFGATRTVEFSLPGNGAIAFIGLMRLAQVSPEVVIRLLGYVACLEPAELCLDPRVLKVPAA